MPSKKSNDSYRIQTKTNVYRIHYTETLYADITTANGEERKAVDSENKVAIVALPQETDRTVSYYNDLIIEHLTGKYVNSELVSIEITSKYIIQEDLININ